MTADRLDLPQGTLELLILKTLALEPRHGWGISERIRQVSREVLEVRQGSLYPALHRLERRGWIAASWGTSEHNRRAKYYALTPKGTPAARIRRRGVARAHDRGRSRAGRGIASQEGTSAADGAATPTKKPMLDDLRFRLRTLVPPQRRGRRSRRRAALPSRTRRGSGTRHSGCHPGKRDGGRGSSSARWTSSRTTAGRAGASDNSTPCSRTSLMRCA